MASIRPSGSPPPPPSSTPVEAWAVRLAFGFMIVGMAGFVVYDLLDSGRAKASTESDEPTVEEVAPPSHTTTERQPSRPSRFSKSGRGPAAAAPMGAAMGNEESEPAEEIATNMVAPPSERAPRSFLGSPMGRMRPGGMEMHPPNRSPARFEPRAEPEPPPPPEPTPEPPPEQPVEQPVEQPTDQPTDQPEQPTEEPQPEQPEQPDQPIDQPEQVEPIR